MNRIFPLVVVACGSSDGSPNTMIDAPADHQVDAAALDGPPHITTYAHDTLPGSCDGLGSPTALPILGFIHATDVADLPRSFRYFDSTRTRFSIAEQGYVMLFDSSNANITTLVDPVQIPATAEPNGIIAPLWDFHVFFVPERSVFDYDVVGDHMVIEWNDFAIGRFGADQDSHISMQVKLFDDGAIEMHYCTLEPGSTTTGSETGTDGAIGIESPDGAHGVSIGFDQSIASTGTAFRFTPQ